MRVKDSNYGRSDLFRYGIIVPLINGTNPFSTIDEFCFNASLKNYEFNGKVYNFSKRTIKGWYYKYLKSGFDTLCNKKRNDKNKMRKIKNTDVCYRIEELRKKYPRITAKAIYNKLLEDNYIDSSTSIYCIFRYLKNNNLKSTIISKKEKKKYEQDFPNDCWQADTSSGPYLQINGKKYKTYLISIIDDCSRLIVGYDFFFNDNAINMQSVLMSAIKKYGVPKKLYVDNGSPYKNEQLSIITARLGINLIHAKPYSPTGKGKIERSFRTIKDGWMNQINWNSFNSINDIQSSFNDFIYSNYMNKVHSEIKETPNNKFHMYFDKIKRLDNDFIEQSFLHTKYSKVYNNSTIKLNNEVYEVPYKYVGKKIEIRYYIKDLNKVYIYEDNKMLYECTKPNIKDNSKYKRKDNIDYNLIINNEEEVEEMK